MQFISSIRILNESESGLKWGSAGTILRLIRLSIFRGPVARTMRGGERGEFFINF